MLLYFIHSRYVIDGRISILRANEPACLTISALAAEYPRLSSIC